MSGNRIISGSTLEFHGQLVGGTGGRFLSWLLMFLLAFPSWIVVPAVEAALLDETADHLPPAANDSYNFAIGDVTGDGYPDVINTNRGRSRLLINDQSGAFVDETDARLPLFLQTTTAAQMGDVDGDGDQDVMLVGSGRNRLLINDLAGGGSGAFTDESDTRMPMTVSFSMDVAFADVDNDGDLDAVIASRGSQNSVLINDGAGNFSEQSATRLPADSDKTYAVALKDIDGDGRPDIFFANQGAQNRVLINNQLGVFSDTTATALPVAVNSSNDAALADVDKDGDNDLIVAEGAAGLGLLLNDGTGNFTPAPAGQLPVLDVFAIKVATGDIDFDGSIDIIVANAGQDLVLLNDGNGSFSDATASELPIDDTRTFGVALFDADKDLDLDLLAATPQGQNRYYNNALLFPRILLGISPAYIEVTDTVTISVDSFDEDGVASVLVEVIEPDASVAMPTPAGAGSWTFVPGQIGVHTVRVTATDNLGNIGIREETFDALANDVADPVVGVTVTPATVLQGQLVTIEVTATDDRGVVSREVLVNGIPVPLDAGGIGTYAPLTVGALGVVASASDAAGNTGSASTLLTVNADAVPPTLSVTAIPDPIDITNPITVNASASDNVTVASLTVTVTGPAGGPVDEPVALNASGQGSYTPFLPGTYVFTATASDPAGNSVASAASVEAQGVPDAEDPVVTLQVIPGNTIPGNPVTLRVVATDNIFVVSRSLEINGAPIPLDGANEAQFTPSVLGDYTAVARAFDPSGNEGSDTVVFSAVDPATDVDAPVVAITDPAEGSDIAGQAVFTGTVTDLLLTEYRLEYAPAGSSSYTTFFTGNQQVMDGVLGSLDTSVLVNGIYHIRLTAEDINGLSSSVTKDYVVTGDAKPGLLQLTFIDLNIPIAGVPIIVQRTYDSSVKTRGDFGVGWNMEITQGSVTHNRIPGEGWQGLSGGIFGGLPCLGGMDETLYHITYLKVSDRESYRFGFKVEGDGSLGVTGGCIGFAKFDYLSGDLPGATLDIIGENEVFVSNGVATFGLTSERFGEIYVPEGLRLTTIDGREIDFNMDGEIENISDRDGNTLFIQPGAIIHSSGTLINIIRDAQGRVTRITDPKGSTLDYAYDANGDLVTFDDQMDNRTTFTYDSNHYLTDIHDPLGNRATRAEYDADGRLIALTNAKGQRTEFSHDVDASQQVITNALGHVSIMQYDDHGNVTSMQRQYTSEGVAKVAVTTYEFDANGNETLVIDPDGVVTQSAFNATNLVTQSVVDPGGLNITSSFTYDASGDRTSSTWPTGEVMGFTFDASGRPTGLQDPSGGVTTFEYNPSGRPTKRIDPTGGLAEMQYDSDGRMTSEILKDVGGSVLSRRESTYDRNGNRLTQTVYRTIGGTSQPFTTTWAYDALNRKVSETDAQGNISRWEYNAIGRTSAMVDRLGRRTTFEYDEVGALVKTTYADGSFFIKEYDELGNLVTETGRDGNRVDYDYDELGNQVTTWLPDDRVVRTVFTGAGRVAAEIGPNGARTDYGYDAAGRKSKTIMPLVFDGEAGANVRPEINHEYDASGTLSAEIDPRGNRTEYATDFATRKIITTFPDASVTTRVIDEGWRISGLTDELGNTLTAEYDPVGRLLSVTLPPPTAGDPAPQTSYQYDEAGNLVTQTDALGRSTRFEYDALNRMTKKTLPGGQQQLLGYDAIGNLTSVTDYDGAVTSFEYDAQNRLLKKTSPDGSVVELTYTASAQRSTVTDSRGVTSYIYDTDGRLASLTQPGVGAIDYSYDAFGRLAQAQTINSTVDYTYDTHNRMASVTGPAGAISFTYDAAGNPVTIEYPTGVISTISYNAQNRAVGIEHVASDGTVLASFDYVRNAQGRVDQITENDGSTELYKYDAIGRLVSETRNGSSVYARTHEYDLTGNRISQVADGVTTLFNYDINDQLVSATGPGGVTGYTYDDKGNLTQRDTGGSITSFDWDSSNHLTGVAGPAGTVNYGYDFDGNRVTRTMGATEVNYLVDKNNLTGLPQVLEEHDDSGNLLASYDYGTDLFSTSRAGVNSFYHNDLHGSTRLLTDDAEAVTDRYGYEGYGNLVSSSGSTTNDYLYTGEQFDPDAGLYYLRARYYDPIAGRFISRDPFQGEQLDPRSLHPYLYAHADPLNMLDPTGQFSLISISISLSIQSIGRAINFGRKVYQLCKLKDKLSKIQFLLGFLRGVMVAGGRFGGIQGLGAETTLGGGTGFSQTTFEFKYEAIDGFNLGDGIKEASYKTQLKYAGDIPGGGPEPWFEVGAKTFQGEGLKVGAAYSSWDRFVATTSLGVEAEVTLAKYKTCGIDSLELLAGSEISVAPFGAGGLPAVGGKIYLKADFFGGLAAYSLNLLTFP